MEMLVQMMIKEAGYTVSNESYEYFIKLGESWVEFALQNPDKFLEEYGQR